MAIKITNQPFATFMSMEVEELAATCTGLLSLKTSEKEAKEDHKGSWKVAAKVLCAVKENLVRSQRARLVPMNRTVKEHFEALTARKGFNLSGHCYALADAFSVYVTSQKISEEQFDLASANALETAGRIHAECVAAGGGMAHEAVAKAAKLVATRADGYQKMLKALLDGLKAPKKLKEEDVRSYLLRAFADGHAEVVACELAAEMPAMRDRGDADWMRHRIHHHLVTGFTNLGTPAELASWAISAAPPVPATQAPAPQEPAALESDETDPEVELQASDDAAAEAAAPETDEQIAARFYPGSHADEITAVAAAIEGFRCDQGRNPASAEELDAYMNAEPADAAK